MKRIFVAWLGLMAFAGASATAADLPRYQPVAPMYNPIYNWTGFYVGINGGGAWGNSQWDGLNKFDLSGGMIGGTIGYNWQVGQIVVGAEGDIDWSGVKGNTGVLCGATCETRNKRLIGYGTHTGESSIERTRYNSTNVGLSIHSTSGVWFVKWNVARISSSCFVGV